MRVVFHLQQRISHIDIDHRADAGQVALPRPNGPSRRRSVLLKRATCPASNEQLHLSRLPQARPPTQPCRYLTMERQGRGKLGRRLPVLERIGAELLFAVRSVVLNQRMLLWQYRARLTLVRRRRQDRFDQNMQGFLIEAQAACTRPLPEERGKDPRPGIAGPACRYLPSESRSTDSRSSRDLPSGLLQSSHPTRARPPPTPLCARKLAGSAATAAFKKDAAPADLLLLHATLPA